MDFLELSLFISSSVPGEHLSVCFVPKIDPPWWWNPPRGWVKFSQCCVFCQFSFCFLHHSSVCLCAHVCSQTYINIWNVSAAVQVTKKLSGLWAPVPHGSWMDEAVLTRLGTSTLADLCGPWLLKVGEWSQWKCRGSISLNSLLNFIDWYSTQLSALLRGLIQITGHGKKAVSDL